MAVTGKPKSNQAAETKPAATKNEAAIFQIIGKGGSAAEKAEGRGLQHPLKFHDAKLWDRLEAARKNTPVKLPRNTWILQAIHEKLEREGC